MSEGSTSATHATSATSAINATSATIARRRHWRIGLILAAALGLLGCDAGGLLEVDTNKPPAKAHAATDLVNGGTRAQNGKHKVVYVVGQPSPQQGVATSQDQQRVNGGLTGAMSGE